MLTAVFGLNTGVFHQIKEWFYAIVRNGPSHVSCFNQHTKKSHLLPFFDLASLGLFR